MDEEFKSFIVTNPDLVDEGIDISGLRTQTDVSPYLLGEVAPGIKYEGIGQSPTAIQDLVRYFRFGLPATDTAQIPGAIDTLVDTGGGGTGDGGQATAPVTGDSTATPIIPIEPGTFTAESLDESFAGEEGPATQPVTGGITSDPIQMENIMDYENPYDVPMNVDDPGASIENLLQPNVPGTIKGAVDPQPVRTILGPDGITYDAVTGQPIVDDPTTRLPQLGSVTEEDLVDNRNLLQKLGLPADFDIKRAALEAGINLVAGVPITLLARGLGIGLDALGNILPEGNIAPSTNLARSTGLLQGDNTVTQDIYGINTQTSFDPVQSTINYNEYNVEQVEKLENRLEELKTDKYTKDGVFNEQAYLDNTKRMRQELEDRKEYLDTVNKDPLYGGDIDERDQMLEDIVLQNKIDAGIQAADDDKGDDMLDTSTGVNPFADIDTGVGEFDITPGTGITRPGTGTVLGKPDIEKFDDAEASIDMFDTTPVDTTVTGTLGPPSEISGPQVTEEKPVDIELADNRAVRELNSDQIIEYENLTNQLEGQEMQKTGNPDISLFKQEEIKNKAIDQIKEDAEFSDEAFMVGDTSTAAPTTGESGVDSFFDAVDTATGGGGGRDRDPDPSPSFDPGQGFVDTGGGGEFETGPVSTFSAEEEDEIGEDRGGGGNGGGQDKGGCVIATHAVNSGAFTKDTKREAVRWCVKNLHGTWWGEAIRRGYRYYGQKAIEEGKAKNHYQEFKDYVAFGTGKRRTLKTGWTFVYRSIQFFIRGLING